jgi:hypothetical protein
LRLQAIAIDSMPATNNGPHKVPSNLLSFRIVTAEDLMAKAMDAKRSVREQIRQAIENQTDVLERSRAATKDAAQSTTIGIAQREIKSCLDAEIQICDQVSNCVTRLDAVLEQLRNNRVVAGSDDMWLRANVVGPLRKLLAAIPPIAQGFLAARPVTDPKVLVPKINDLIQAQEQLIRAMEAIVAEMRKFEDAVEIERTTRGLIRKLDEIRAIMRPDKAGKKSENPPALEKKQ